MQTKPSSQEKPFLSMLQPCVAFSPGVQRNHHYSVFAFEGNRGEKESKGKEMVCEGREREGNGGKMKGIGGTSNGDGLG